MARAALWQLLFVLRGASEKQVRRLADRGLGALAGIRPEDLAALVGEAMEPVLKPLLAPSVVQVARDLGGRGYRTYIVSTALQEIVDAIAADLQLEGGIGTVCEVVDGVYTGRALRALHGREKAVAVQELAAAEGIDLAISTAYSDSYSDLPFLEVVGQPVAVNPDRALRRVAQQRGWAILEGSHRPLPPAVYVLPLLLGLALAARTHAT